MTDSMDDALRCLVAAGANYGKEDGDPSVIVIPQNEPTPGTHPERPYATVLLIREIERGQTPSTSYGEVASGVQAIQQQHFTRHYSVEFHGKGAKAALEESRAWIASIDLGADAAATGAGTEWPAGDTWPAFTVTSLAEAQNIDEIVSGDWEERWGIEIVIEFTRIRRYDLERIDTVPLTFRRE